VLAVLCGLMGLVAVAGSAGAAGTHAPVGAFDGITARFGNPAENAPDVLQLSGWAADQDAPGQLTVVHIYVDGQSFQEVWTGSARPDVASAHPWAGPNQGWTTTISLRTFPNNGVLCAYAIDLPGGGPSTLLGCHDLSKPSPKDPIGSFDAAYAAPGQIHLLGWAGDPDGRSITRLRVFYDGARPYVSEMPVLEPSADRARPDVKAAFPKLSSTTGFDLTLPITPGVHTICIEGQNTGPSGLHNLDLGCVHGTIPGSPPPGPHDPRGSLDGVTPTSFSECSAPCRWNATGWAYDPDTGGPVHVRVRAVAVNDLDTRNYPGNTVANVVRLSTGVYRPDVQKVVPAAGPTAGFNGFAILGGSGYIRVACAWAINVGPGHDRLLGCMDDY
jgi:hypothetical protein